MLKKGVYGQMLKKLSFLAGFSLILLVFCQNNLCAEVELVVTNKAVDMGDAYKVSCSMVGSEGMVEYKFKVMLDIKSLMFSSENPYFLLPKNQIGNVSSVRVSVEAFKKRKGRYMG